MTPGAPREAGDRPDVGLCAGCRHAAVQRNVRGSEFWRCQEADRDSGRLRYPPLPVVRCGAFERGAPQTQ